MAQSGYTPIALYYSTTASAAPTAGNLVNGELAINITDKKLYAKDNAGNVFLLADASSGGTTASNLAGGAAGSVPYQSGANATTFLSIGTAAQVLQVNAGATAPEWVSSTGTGNVVRASSPTLTTPTLGVATVTSVNKVAITAPATSATLTIADGKTLTASNTLTFTGTDSSSIAFGTGGTVTYTSNNLSVFAATTSAQLAGVISDETGSGSLVFGTSPTLATPTITTSATVPLVIGGTGTTSTLTLRSTSGVGTTGADIIFQAGNNGATETARILNSGKFLVGRTTAASVAGVASDHNFKGITGNNNWVGVFENAGNSTPFGLAVYYSGSSPNVADYDFLWCNDSTGRRFSVRSNGGVVNYQANDSNLSDVRRKKNICLAGNYLEKICAIPVKTFLYVDQTDSDTNLGVIAQDVEAVAPELVDNSGFGSAPEGEPPYKAVYQTDLQYALMKCIQEQQVMIVELQNRLSKLEQH